MNIRKVDGVEEFNITPLTAEPNYEINYNLIEKSDKKVISIDRGNQTDRYACTMVFRESIEKINELYKLLNDLRINGSDVILGNLPDNYFGDHIGTQRSFNCVVYDIKELKSPVMNVKEVEVTFLTTSITDADYIGTAELPALDCLEAGYATYNNWNTTVNETYNRNNYFADKETDKFVFQGKYRLSKEANTNLQRYWAETQRGSEFTIVDGDWGVDGMFGPNADTYQHDVVIEGIKYEPIGPSLRDVEITLIRNSGGGSACTPAVFIVQPTDQTVSSGTPAVFTTTVTGTAPLVYQWYEQLSTESVPYFEAGTTEYPFAGTDFTVVSGTYSFDGDTASNNLLSGESTAMANYSGDVTYASIDVTGTGYTQTPALYAYPLKSDDNNRMFVAYYENFSGGPKIRALFTNGGVSTSVIIESLAVTDIVRIEAEFFITGADVQITGTAHRSGGTTIPFDSGVVSNVYNTAIKYYPILGQANASSVWTDLRVEGEGFPYTDTVIGDFNAMTGETASSLTVTPGLDFYEAGTTEYPFAGTVGSPVASDPKWDLSRNSFSFHGDYMKANQTTGGVWAFAKGIDYGTIDYVSFDCTNRFVGISDINSTLDPITRINFVTMYYSATTGLSVYSYVDSVYMGVGSIFPPTPTDIDRVVCTMTVSGEDIIYSGTAYETNGTPHNIDYTGVGYYNPLIDYSQHFGTQDTASGTCDYVRIEGEGFPNATDLFGTNYKCQATSPCGGEFSDTVTTIEAINFFEAGTVEYPFAGTVSVPVSNDPNWTPILTGRLFSGDYVIQGEKTTGEYMLSTHFGVIDKFELQQTQTFKTETGFYASSLGGIGASDSRYSPLVRQNLCFFSSYSTVGLSFLCYVGGTLIHNDVIVAWADTHPAKGVDVTYERNGADLRVYGTATVNVTNNVYAFDKTYVGAYNEAVTYSPMLALSPNTEMTTDYVRVEGEGFPY